MRRDSAWKEVHPGAFFNEKGFSVERSASRSLLQ